MHHIAASIQQVAENVVLRLAHTLHRETGERYLCLAGGVALDCVANGSILRAGDLYVTLHIALPPATSDKAKKNYRNMQQELDFNPRAGLGV